MLPRLSSGAGGFANQTKTLRPQTLCAVAGEDAIRSIFELFYGWLTR